jgi:hypothetical protein
LGYRVVVSGLSVCTESLAHGVRSSLVRCKLTRPSPRGVSAVYPADNTRRTWGSERLRGEIITRCLTPCSMPPPAGTRFQTISNSKNPFCAESCVANHIENIFAALPCVRFASPSKAGHRHVGFPKTYSRCGACEPCAWLLSAWDRTPVSRFHFNSGRSGAYCRPCTPQSWSYKWGRKYPKK